MLINNLSPSKTTHSITFYIHLIVSTCTCMCVYMYYDHIVSTCTYTCTYTCTCICTCTGSYYY